MILWKKWLDPYIKVISVMSQAFLPVVLTLPGCQPSVHVALYLPTHGHDVEFVTELANLRNCLDNLIDDYDNPLIYLRGDGNVNIKNVTRVKLLDSLVSAYKLSKSNMHHKTYHHFVGGGQFDSNVDIILHPTAMTETVTSVLCKLKYPAISSHHDVILSSFKIPEITQVHCHPNLVTAPKLDHARTKIMWSEQGIADYSALMSDKLNELRTSWLNPSSQVSMSILLSLTSSMMTFVASATNGTKVLSKRITQRRKKLPKQIFKAKKNMEKALRKVRQKAGMADTAKLGRARKVYHQSVRLHNIQADIKRDQQLYNIMRENPNKVFSFIRSSKSNQTSTIAKLTVGSKTYFGKQVADGFYDSMSSLKRCNFEELKNDEYLADKFIDYDLIVKICQNYDEIPTIDLEKSTKLLMRLKKDVSDHYSITPLHYTYAGQEGLRHFNLVMNGIISEINNAGLDELNTAHGLILYKFHGKEKTSDRSYRNISTCPLLAKAIDLYLRELYHDLWQEQQAETQYQGPGSSHELASLLLTEVIQYSLFTAKQPVYLLALDAQSAFDRCLRQVLVSELYKAKLPPSSIIFIAKRLESRKTVYEWEGVTMGPAEDMTGFEQGGINSSDYYKLYNNDQLKSSQESLLGVDIGSGIISAIGQADDVILASPSPYKLQLLVHLTEMYCARYRVRLEPTKTKLLVYSQDKESLLVDHALNCHTITLNKIPVSLVTETDHVGVLRSSAGNLPHILQRIARHKKAIFALLPAGLAKRHRANPAASVKVSQIYATPVLFSGTASLVLTQAEIDMLDGHYLLKRFSDSMTRPQGL